MEHWIISADLNEKCEEFKKVRRFFHRPELASKASLNLFSKPPLFP